MTHRYRHRLLATCSFAAGALVTWVLTVTGTDGEFFRSLLYPWMFAAVLLGGVILGMAATVRTAVAALVPFAVPPALLAVWRGADPAPDAGGLWLVGLAVSCMLLLFAVGAIAVGVCVRLMFRR
ncbi:hypothetical protein GCM10009677_36080 [Sphaerisporangium rubeum]|uniref:Uncharacterized protein n=1 Tax=Sphaerisporangium rubeum TaxID=321317 RepID=A0A7X0M6H4_9ACTN|nr:hypothetical protein [Sphaerisporangium rubeum]MBB6471846.1 hypothetical protein [Sphaerisporangium rubeum]